MRNAFKPEAADRASNFITSRTEYSLLYRREMNGRTLLDIDKRFTPFCAALTGRLNFVPLSITSQVLTI